MLCAGAFGLHPRSTKLGDRIKIEFIFKITASQKLLIENLLYICHISFTEESIDSWQLNVSLGRSTIAFFQLP
jgi:hypothetical protein